MKNLSYDNLLEIGLTNQEAVNYLHILRKYTCAGVAQKNGSYVFKTYFSLNDAKNTIDEIKRINNRHAMKHLHKWKRIYKMLLNKDK